MFAKEQPELHVWLKWLCMCMNFEKYVNDIVRLRITYELSLLSERLFQTKPDTTSSSATKKEEIQGTLH